MSNRQIKVMYLRADRPSLHGETKRVTLETILNEYVTVATVYEREMRDDSDTSVLDCVFREFNLVEEGDDEKPWMREVISAARAGLVRHTSMSVGDVILFEGRYHVCESFGWRDVGVPGLKRSS